MPVTFINRNIRNFERSSELAAINAHHAHIKHEKRRHAIRDAARRRNAELLSYVEVSDASPPLLFYQIGGLRDDPFWTLPVKNTCDAMTGFDHHFQVLCPLALRLGNYNDTQHHFMRINVLETGMYCSSMIALNLTMQRLHMDSTARLSRAALYHLNNAVVQLREALQDPETSTSDIVLATIFPMAVVYRMLNDHAAFDAHVQGVRRIVALRGGLDYLGWSGFLKISAVGMFESAAVLHRQQTQRSQDEAQGLQLSNDSFVEYPSKPFPQALRAKISKYPPGLARLAFDCRLSLQCINFLEIFCQWLANNSSSPGPHDSMTELAHDVLAMSGLNTTERVIAVAIQSYVNWLERTVRRWSNFSSEHNVTMQIASLNQKSDLEDCDEDALAWACLMIRDTNPQGTGSWQWATKGLSAMDMGGEREVYLDQLFFKRPDAASEISEPH
ncbi:uncharacterized protein Z520_00904 [Fonsecaea multimorphosa CBS 102226]|uniref:Transcription factor domain-containing protein n=1 Tax=Fonsecaea multimorphosa CBS 102226 TaxID=1442371 RepID=A0A0D2HQT5_9EURO|nr:uncharacterized protein Z520_00904 [Fonsecaea multimorphosa CBS 102226]KIY04211.1 hypothetical protein Z520_00904 [Fonsecaea multimorphosa CBS 102226]OAL32037.1 hypothetical protein AYO22_00907 [Fonsecaea multimorphosa]